MAATFGLRASVWNRKSVGCGVIFAQNHHTQIAIRRADHRRMHGGFAAGGTVGEMACDIRAHLLQTVERCGHSARFTTFARDGKGAIGVHQMTP